MTISTKPFKIMTLLIAAFFICWLPIQILSVLDLDRTEYSFAFDIAQLVSYILARANSFLNPFIYAFMAKDLNKKCYSFLSKIESAIDEETQSDFRATSTNSEDTSFPMLSEILTRSHELKISLFILFRLENAGL